ncbi:MAG: dockerin type I repeat-containing protein [Muribaculaceae bacterium]|nr:dockerin type I repeat-containing protein [Muribaculaceae bacterium]
MKKFSLLIAMLAVAVSAVAQSTLPRPKNPSIDEWIDYQPVIWNDTITGEPVAYQSSSQLGFTIGMDIMQRPVADDYTGWEIDECITGELTYTLLDEQYVSYTIFTDFDEVFVFTPEMYPQFEEPTTRIPFGYMGGDIEYWFVHFPGKTNNIEPLLEAGFDVEPFFQWRIGIRTNYIVGDQESYSDIVYWEICDKPVTLLGDVNDDGVVDIVDITDLIDYILNGTTAINKFNADLSNNNNIEIVDVTSLIDQVLNGPAA